MYMKLLLLLENKPLEEISVDEVLNLTHIKFEKTELFGMKGIRIV